MMNYGKIRSLDRYVRGRNNSKRLIKGKILNPTRDKDGYLCIIIEGKTMKLHRLVASSFIPNPYNKKEVNHKDCNIVNNNINNLEWVTRQENSNHAKDKNLYCSGNKHWKSRKVLQLSLDDVFIKEYSSLRKAATKIKGCHTAISRVCRGKQKTAYNFKWKYEK